MQQTATHNQPEFTVSEISGAIRYKLENAFSYVRVRGEISQGKLYSSGHYYFSLKDEGAVLSSVIWKGKYTSLKIKPEDGMEVIATGKVSTFGGQSKYQLIVDSIEPAGAGALMALLEKRKAELAAKGLFDKSRKKPIPFMPRKIGVVTSPSGAVIRDIMHRITERFPTHVVVWPVRVQGKCAEDEIAEAIRGFNSLPDAPELIIVARGGGSLEDLWCFNEEAVVYAVAESKIPVISAVGHETDTTLIDYVADLRAPTPTAAAEFATPVIADLKFAVTDLRNRMDKTIARKMDERRQFLSGLVRGLPKLSDILGNYEQKLDSWQERLKNALPTFISNAESRLHKIKFQPSLLQKDISKHTQELNLWHERMKNSAPILLGNAENRLQKIKFQPQLLMKDIEKHSRELSQWFERLSFNAKYTLEKKEEKTSALIKLFDSYNYKNVLKRGFAIAKTKDGKLVKSAATAPDAMRLEFADGEIEVNKNT